MSDPIRFYRANEKPYGVFSNLHRRPFRFMGREWPTAEHAYQFGKAAKPEVREWLMAAPSPALLAMAAHGLFRWDITPKWADIKITRMRMVLWAKFGQHPDLHQLLMKTWPSPLIETATVDNAVNRFWGEVNGRGQNWLGLLLSGMREDFRQGILTPDILQATIEGLDPDGSRCVWYAGPAVATPVPDGDAPSNQVWAAMGRGVRPDGALGLRRCPRMPASSIP